MQAKAQLMRLVCLDQFLLEHLLNVKWQSLLVQSRAGLPRAQLVLQFVVVYFTNQFRLFGLFGVISRLFVINYDPVDLFTVLFGCFEG